MNRFPSAVVLTLAAIVAPALVPAPVFGQVHGQLVASGLTLPLAIVQMPGQPNVELVVEQGGRIRVVQNGVVLPTSFLDVSAQITSGGERGLLGLALAPDYPTSGRFWVNFTDLAGNTVVARFKRSQADPLVADPASRFDLVWPGGVGFIPQPFSNHNGGNIIFGSDGFLYIGMGDGGGANDTLNNAQNPQSLLGKMLRIDVNVPDSDPRGYRVPANNPFVGQAGVMSEIWDFGVRNPWRWSFDDPSRGGTGALVIGDVGQNAFEEIDYEPAGLGGRNYGWRIREGLHPNVTTLPPAFLPLTDPVFEYSHAVGDAITGGFVYRGRALGAAFTGRYFFGDFVVGRVWSLGLVINPQTGEATAGDLQEHTAELGGASGSPSSFGVDAAGEIYVVNYAAGDIYRIAPGAGCATPDPFVAFGGGTCVNGGWLPPGIAPPSQTPPPPPVAGGCITPDPFVAFGGGTCVNGGWLPPGLSPPPAPPPPPPPTPGGCITPDPFVALGGGTCVNGGWLPPGIAPPPQTTPPPPPPPGGCITPDPFVAFGGGTCVNGGWLPPGIAPPPQTTPPPPPPPPVAGGCTTPDPFVSIPGLVGVCLNGGWMPVSGVAGLATVHLAAATNTWVIAADNGRTYVPVGGLATTFMVDGLRVNFKAKLRPDLQATAAGPFVDILSIATVVGPEPRP